MSEQAGTHGKVDLILRWMLILSALLFIANTPSFADSDDDDGHDDASLVFPYFNNFEKKVKHDGWETEGYWHIRKDHGAWTSHSGKKHLDNNKKEKELTGKRKKHSAELERFIPIPADAFYPVLSFWHKLQLNGDADFVTIEIRIKGESEHKRDKEWHIIKTYTKQENTPVYVLQEISLDAYRGMEIGIRFVQKKEHVTGAPLWVIDDFLIGESADQDGDGIPDSLDTDRDGDGISNDYEIQVGTNPDDPGSVPPDLDSDGIPDSLDPERDGDGVNNTLDAFPDDPAESSDLDGDGIGDNADTDRDGDGYNNDVEIQAGTDPNDPTSHPGDADRDGDGVPDAQDLFPDDPTEWADLDGDGIGDNADTDRDGDGISNDYEIQVGTDPNDPNSTPPDLDADGIPDSLDLDRDGDGFNNDVDLFPDDPAEWADLDGDGIGNNSDPDRDGDGITNELEVIVGTDPDDPLSVPPDLDGDGFPDSVDSDRDGDGVDNTQDAFPDDPAEWADLDGDGIGDNSDPDRDGDGISNDYEIQVGTDPDDPNSTPPDMDGDGIPDSLDDDQDGDGFTVSAGDCVDTDPAIHPGAVEVCDGIDNNCDGQVDEGVLNACGTCGPVPNEVCDGLDNNCNGLIDEGYDQDADGYTSCGGDCNDADPAIHPGAPELQCDGIDQDCDGSDSCITTCTDNDGDGYGNPGGASCPNGSQSDCDDSNADIHPGAPELCDGLDNDCDTIVPANEADADNDTYRICAGDCDDADAAVNPGALEICDTIDNNCDAQIDEGFDQDADGYTTCGGDCDDTDPAIHPGVTEVCDGIDNNCNGLTDEGLLNACGTCGPVPNEVCDGIDNNCDGRIDEGCLTAILISPGAMTLTAAGATQQLAVTGYYAEGTTGDLTASTTGTTYSSDNSSVAAVDSEGLVTALADGTATITASNTGFTATAVVTVTIAVQDHIPPQLTISSPQQKAVLYASTVDVTGTVNEPVQSVTVNGTPATVSGLNFTAAGVALDQCANTITVDAVDLAGNSNTRSITVYNYTLPPAVTAESGYLVGYALEYGTETPIQGARITVDGICGSLLTDANGRYVFPLQNFNNYSPTRYFDLKAEKDGYTYVHFQAEGMIGKEMPADPVHLTPIDPQVTTITPALGGTAVNSLGDTEVVIPPGAVDVDTDVTITMYDTEEQLPAPLKGRELYAIGEFGPHGTVFNVPVTVRLPNRYNMPPGTLIPCVDYDPQNKVWNDVGDGIVSADGLFIELQVQHFSWYGGVWIPVKVDDDQLNATTTDDQIGNDTCEDGVSDQQVTDCVGSSVTLKGGRLELGYTLPSYTSIGQEHALRLTYNSGTAYPQVSVSFSTNTSRTPKRTKVNFAAFGMQTTEYFGSDNGKFTWMTEAKDAQGNFLPTGIYPYSMILTNTYDITRHTQVTPGNWVDSTIEKGYTNNQGGSLFVNNQVQSPLGAGWSLRAVSKLINDPALSLIIQEGNGKNHRFEPFDYWIDTVAGGGSSFPDGVPLAAANLPWMKGIAIDPEGNIIIVDQNLKLALKIDVVRDIISVIAGGGNPSDGLGDGLPATKAKLYGPEGVAVDKEGNIYIADTWNSRVRKVDLNGVISTAAKLNYGPYGVGVEPDGNLLIAGGSRIDRLDVTSGMITTIASSFNDPRGVAEDNFGNIYVAEFSGNRVSKIDPLGNVSVVAGTGNRGSIVDGVPATESDVYQPIKVAVDKYGNLFICEHGTGRIRKVSIGGIISTVAGGGNAGLGDGGPAPAAQLSVPQALTLDSAGTLYIGDAGHGRVRVASLSLAAKASGAGLQMTSKEGESTLTYFADGTAEWVLKDGTRKTFDVDGLQTATIDRNGNTTTYQYDTSGNLTSITDPAGLVTTLSYSGGKLSSVTTPDGRVTTFTHDADGNLTSITEPDGSVTQYQYDNRHLVTAKIRPGNLTTQYNYDAHGRIASVIAPTGETRNYAPADATGLINDLPPGTGTKDNPAPNIPAAPSIKTDGMGYIHSYDTDARGATLAYTDPLGNLTQYERDGQSRPTRIIQSDGTETTMTYDEKGNLLTTTNTATGATTTMTYNAFSQVTSITDPLGNITNMTYDPNGNLTDIADAQGNQTTFTYDTRGLVTSMTDALGDVTSYTYDTYGNLASVTDPLGKTTSYTRDAAGNILTRTDANGNITTYTYDSRNRITSVTDAEGNTTSYTYAPSCGCSGAGGGDRLASITDAKGNTTSFAYNEIGQLISETDPMGRITTYSYDANRQLATRTDPNGNTITYTYDELNRLIQKQMPGDTVDFTYDVVGRLLTAADTDSSINFTYDTAGRLTDVVNTLGAVSYSYDLNGNRITMTDAEGGITDYVYDALNRLTDIMNPAGETSSFTYDALSRRVETLLPNGGQTTYTYDAASRLLDLVNQVNAASVSNFNYTYDNVGNRITMTDKDGLHNYTYDTIYRLLTATHPQPENPAESFTYDPVDNRLSDGTYSDHAYNADNQLTSYDSTTYTYDNNGNTISKTDVTGTTYYTYDPENRLTRIDFPDGTYATYQYDPFGRRIQKNVNGTITQYLYDGEDILAEYDATNTRIVRYTHGPGIDEPLIMERGGQSYYYHADGLGSITEITDATGNIVNSYVYNSFGKIVKETEAVQNSYTYTAREYDPESGLYFYRARYYDASIGRFISVDPLGLAGGINLYTYVLNNPVNNTDPFGEISLPEIMAAVTIITAVVVGHEIYKDLNEAHNKGQEKRELENLLDEERKNGYPDPDYAQDLKDAIDKARQEGIEETSEATKDAVQFPGTSTTCP